MRRERIKAGYRSQRALADASGVSAATISRIESGLQLPEPLTLKALAETLGYTHKELLKAAGYISHEKIIKPAEYHALELELLNLKLENEGLKAQLNFLKQEIKNLKKGE